MLVEMNNMDFGEFIQIYDNCEPKKVLTIDCGSLNKRKFSYIVSKKLDFDTPIMITHLHDDHMNYFVKFANQNKKKFSKVYLPCITTHNNGYGFIEILSKAILDYMGGRKNEASYNNNFLNKIKEILSITEYKNIDFLKCGRSIDLNEMITMKVLWPLIDNSEKSKLCPIDIVKKTVDSVMKKVKHVCKIKNLSNDYYKKLQLLEQNITEIVRVNYDFYSNNSNQNYGGFVNLDDYYKNLEKIKLFFGYKINLINYTIHKEDINNLSIVCEISENNKCALFTGDINWSKVGKHIASHFDILDGNIRYDLCKIPHHGTEKYINGFPHLANKYIVSNGNHKRYCIGGSINRFKPLECTNGGKYCKLVSLTGSCCSNHLCMNGKTIAIKL